MPQCTNVRTVSAVLGFMVGRALWGEAALAPAEERPRLLDELVRPRMQQLRAIID